MERDIWVPRTKSKQRKNRVGLHVMSRKRPSYLYSGKRSEDSENVQVSGLNVRCQRRSRERCKQQSKDCLVKVEGNYCGDVRQEQTNKVEDKKVYKTAIKPAMVYYAECWAVRKKEERKLHTTEMRMLRWARGKTRLDHVRNEDIWKEAHMCPMAEFLREKRLRWFGHVQRRDIDDATRKILQMEVEGKRNRGRPKLRWRDLVKDDMARNQITTEMAEDRRHWHVMIRAGTLRRWRWEGEKRTTPLSDHGMTVCYNTLRETPHSSQIPSPPEQACWADTM